MPLPRCLILMAILPLLLTSGCLSDTTQPDQTIQQQEQKEPPLPPPIPPVTGEASAPDLITGFTMHPVYTNFAQNESMSGITDSYTFTDAADRDTVPLAITDHYIYQHAYISYAGNDWTEIQLQGNIGTHYISNQDGTKATATAPIDIYPSLFSLTTPGQSASNNYLVAYTCDSDFQCYGGWQIWNFSVEVEEEQSPPSTGTIYYVSNSSIGNDNNDGTDPNFPWKTINKVNTYQNFQPGDSILFRRGDIWREQLVVPESGNSTDGAYDTGEKPKIFGSEQTSWNQHSGNIWVSASTFADPYNMPGTAKTEIFFIENGEVKWSNERNDSIGELSAEYDWTWDNETTQDDYIGHIYIYSPTGTDPNAKYSEVEIPQRGYAIFIDDREYITIDSFHLAYVAGSTIATENPQKDTTGLTIKNCYMHHVGSRYAETGYHIATMRNDMLIQNNEVFEAGRRGMSAHIYGSEGMTIDGITVEGNYFHDGYHSVGANAALGGWEDDNTIRNIIVRNNVFAQPENIPGVTYGASMVTFTAFDDDGGLNPVIENVEIYNNVFRYCDGSQIWLRGIDGAKIYHNTFYDFVQNIPGGIEDVRFQVWVSDSCTDVDIKNNLFYGTVDSDYNLYCTDITIYQAQDHNEVEIDYNLMYSEDLTDMAGIRVDGRKYCFAGCTYNMDTIYDDYTYQNHSPTDYSTPPGFVSSSDMHLQSVSPAVDAGVHIPGFHCTEAEPNDEVGCIEWYGNAPDIGAFESPYTASAENVYYVSDSSGDDDTGDGTISKPWKTLQHAADSVTEPGSIIALKKGDTWLLNDYLQIYQGGSDGDYITWDGGLWGTGDNAVIMSGSDGEALVSIANCQYVKIQNIIFDGSQTERCGIVIGWNRFAQAQNDERYITVQNCTIKNIGDPGISESDMYSFLISSWNNDMYNITIANNTFDSLSKGGPIFYNGRHDLLAAVTTFHGVYVGYNTITNIGISHGGGSGIVLKGNVDGAIVEHNYIESGSGGAYAIGDESYSYTDVHRNIAYRYNEIHMTDTIGIWIANAMDWTDGGLINIDIYYNILHSAYGASNSEVIRIANEPFVEGSTINIYNNVISYDSGTRGAWLNPSGSAMTINVTNNIFRGPSGTLALLGWQGTTSTINHNYNSYYSPGANPAYAFNGTSICKNDMATWEPTAQVEDPKLTAEFTDLHLQSDSPCIDNGTNVGLTQDFDGNPIVGAPEIGAFEYQS
jgi:hypothetical protein